MADQTTREASTIVIVENSPVQAKIICRHIEACTRFSTIFCADLAEFNQVLESEAEDVFLAVCNLNLKDAPDGEAVDTALSRNIPCIVLTSTFDDQVRNRYLEKNVLDYLDKSDLANMDNLIELIERIDSNHDIKVLLADDNTTVRTIMKKLLLNQNFTVLEAVDGREALECMEQNPDIRLVVTDYEMPNVDGLQLIAGLREQYPKDKLSIIGVSAHGAGSLTARFLKNGANDFLKKPFEVEEFNCRVNKNVAEVERIKAIKEAYQKDFLVNAANLKHFLESGREQFTSGMVTAAVRVDGLASTNDAHGWNTGDAVLRRTASLIEQNSAGWELIARSGDSFYILANMDPAEVASRLETIRRNAESVPVKSGDDSAELTVSCAFAVNKPGLEQGLAALQAALSKPGSNRVVQA